MSKRSAKDSQEKDLYAILGIAKNATEDDIRKAYKSKARQFHPDHSKEADAEEKFKEITAAHEVLKDAQKREIYDKYGMKGLTEGMPMQGGPFDIFDLLTGRAQQQQQRGPAKSESVKQPLVATLEELYNGAVRKIRVTRTRNCAECKGIGSANKDAVQKCKTCDGVGVVNRIVQIAAGFISQSRAPCQDCQGQGETIDKKFLCKTCSGKKVVSEKKMLEVHIDRGMKHNQKIVFEGEADERPGVLPGDIIFVLQEKEHALFKRDNNNLIMHKKISLGEALTGLEFKFTHLDDRVIVVKSKPGDVIRPNQVKQIENEGFVVPKTGGLQKGNMFIVFDIEFPKSIPDDLSQKLQSILPPKPKVELKDDEKQKAEEVELKEPDVSNNHEHRSKNAYDEDEEEEGRGGGISCASQ